MPLGGYRGAEVHCSSRQLQWTVYDQPRRRLRSASSQTQRLIIRRARLTTAGDRAFGAARRLWNSLPADDVASQSLATFNGQLKTSLFKQSHNPRL